MRPLSRAGFTLIELLVVIGIIGLLVALMFPAVGRVLESSKLMRCTNRLYRIGQAYHVRSSDMRISPERVRPLRVSSWRTLLRPYLGYGSAMLLCPVANAQPGEPADPDDVWDEGVGGGGGGGGGGGSGGGDWTTEPERRSTESLKVEVWLRPGSDFRGVEGNNLIYIMDCEEGQWAMKQNVTEDSYEMVFEDSWNTTWNDLRVRFTEHKDGSLEITYLDEHTGGNCYNLVDITTGEVILRGMGDGNAYHGWPRLPFGTSVTLPPEDQEERLVTDAENPDLLVPEGAGGAPAQRRVATAGNYGMNSIADRRDGLSGHVILCLDYKKTIANGPTTDKFDNWYKRGWQTVGGLPVFARHYKMINVLYSDGSVELTDPHEINPAGMSSVWRYWDPNSAP